MPTVKQISIKSATSATGYDTREIGAEALNVEVQYDASGNIITDLSTQTPDPSKTESLAEVLDNNAPKNHADTTTKYGAASQTEYGHVKVGAGLDVTNGEVSVKYGTTAGTAVEGNDTRLSDDRKNPNALSFADGTSYDGSVAKSIDADSVGAAVKNHASATDEFGAGTQTTFGHVKVSDVYNTDLGTASTSLAASQHAIYEVYQEAIRGSGSAGRELTKAEYDALTPDEKSDGTIYFITDWNQSGGGGGAATATDISFDDEVTQLNVTNVQKAIEKLTDARNIAFDNSTSGITATKVQGAIDELSSKTTSNQQALAAKGDTVEYHEDTQLLLLKSGDNIVSFTHLEAGGGVASILHIETHEETWKGNQNVTIEVKDSAEDITGGHFDENGDYIARLHYLGDYIITVTDEDGTQYIKHFNNEAIGGIYYVFVERYGYLGWLNSANIHTTTIHSLDDVFADEKVLRELMTKHSSVEYLKGWFTNKPEIIDIFVANANAMKWLGLRDYAYDTLTSAINGLEAKILASDNWEYALKDHVPVMTSNTAPYGEASASSVYQNAYHAYRAFDGESMTDAGWVATANTDCWIQYKFTNPIKVNRVSLMPRNSNNNSGINNFKVQGSNDGNIFEDIYTGKCNGTVDSYQTFTFNNNDYYLYYRIHIVDIYSGATYCGLQDLQFYGRELNVSVPKMTSDTAPWGEATSGGVSLLRPAYYAFDNDSSTSAARSVAGEYLPIEYNFNKKVRVSIAFMNAIYDSYKGELQYSDDGANWVSCSDNKSTVANKNVMLVSTENDAHKYWRIYFAYPDSQFSITAVQFYGVDYSEREFEEGSTMKYIYDHGVELEPITVKFSIGSSIGTKTVDQLVLEKKSGAASTGGFYSSAIDFTNYNFERIVLGDTLYHSANLGVPILFVSKSIGGGYGNLANKSILEGEDLPYNFYLDVTNINEISYATIGNDTPDSNSTSKVSVTEWWLE